MTATIRASGIHGCGVTRRRDGWTVSQLVDRIGAPMALVIGDQRRRAPWTGPLGLGIGGHASGFYLHRMWSSPFPSPAPDRLRVPPTGRTVFAKGASASARASTKAPVLRRFPRPVPVVL